MVLARNNDNLRKYVPFFLVSQFLSKHKANTQLMRIYLFNKINPESIVDYVSLPADRQKEIYLQVVYCEWTNIAHLMFDLAVVAQDIPYIKALISQHRREFGAGTQLPNEVCTRVTPIHACRAHFAKDPAVESLERNRRQAELQYLQQNLHHDSFDQANPPDDAGDKVHVVPDNNFMHNGPIVNTQIGTLTIYTTKAYIILGINPITNVICIANASRQSNAIWYIGKILNMLSIGFEQHEIDAIPIICDIHISTHDKPMALVFLKQKGAPLTPNTRSFDNLLSCQELGAHMVFIVAQANPHDQEAAQVDILNGKPYVVYMFLIAGKHIITPFSYTNNIMH